jgi:DNA mismatch endonuclease (patch repair protein)
MDVLTREQRQLNMSRIRGKDTKPELLLRRGLHAAGVRFRLHPLELPGRPDIVFPRYRAIIQVHGCFWHGHGCPLFRWPATRSEFWSRKISRNRERDQHANQALLAAGWRVLTVWECAVRGPNRYAVSEIVNLCLKFIRGRGRSRDVAGRSINRPRHRCAKSK